MKKTILTLCLLLVGFVSVKAQSSEDVLKKKWTLDIELTLNENPALKAEYYKASDQERRTFDSMLGGMTLEFKDNGVMHSSIMGQAIPGTWRKEGNKIHTNNGGNSATLIIKNVSDDKLFLSNPDNASQGMENLVFKAK